MTKFVEKSMVILHVFWKSFWLIAYTVYIKITGSRPKVKKCLVGKTAVVTGGNDGIGYQICMHLASRGCTVIIADRSDSEKSRQKIISETGNPNVISKTFDLASFKSVRDLAKDLNTSLAQLDILVNNAGIASVPPDGQLTEDGLDPVMQINYLGHFLLTHLLLDLLKKSESSRMLFTSSCLSYFEDINLNDFNFDTGKMMMIQMYCNSKWAMLVASNYFDKQLKESGVGGKAFFENQGFSLTPARSKDAQFCEKFIETSQTLVRLSVSERLHQTGKTS